MGVTMPDGKRIVFFGNGPTAQEIYGILNESNEIISYNNDTWDESKREEINAFKPDFGLSCMFGKIFRQEDIDLFPYGILNMHPAYLPFNRGAYPNVWGIVDVTTAGYTLHKVTTGIDTGPIIVRYVVPQYITDTGETLYKRLMESMVNFFKLHWPLKPWWESTGLPQEEWLATTHKVKDVEKIDELKLDETYTFRYILNVLRARTFKGYKGAYFRHNGEKIYMSLQLERENDAE